MVAIQFSEPLFYILFSEITLKRARGPSLDVIFIYFLYDIPDQSTTARFGISAESYTLLIQIPHEYEVR